MLGQDRERLQLREPVAGLPTGIAGADGDEGVANRTIPVLRDHEEGFRILEPALILGPPASPGICQIAHRSAAAKVRGELRVMFLEGVPERLNGVNLVRFIRVAQGDLRLRWLHPGHRSNRIRPEARCLVKACSGELEWRAEEPHRRDGVRGARLGRDGLRPAPDPGWLRLSTALPRPSRGHVPLRASTGATSLGVGCATASLTAGQGRSRRKSLFTSKRDISPMYSKTPS
jgi:hypothetical protein